MKVEHWDQRNPPIKIKGVELHCSFCGGSSYKRDRLICGPNVFICNECVDLCVDLLKEQKGIMG